MRDITDRVDRMGHIEVWRGPAEQQPAALRQRGMRHIGRPEDIRHAAAFLAGDVADFLTVTHLFVDGGLAAQLES